MNKAKKGQRKEYQTRKELEADGWTIVFKSIRNRYGCIDFGPFDCVAFKGKERKYISNKHFGQGNYYLPHQQEIKDFKEKHGYPGESFELHIWKSPRWEKSGKNKKWNKGKFIKLVL